MTLTGPQVLGTMDVSGFVAGGKHKRKRLQKGERSTSAKPRRAMHRAAATVRARAVRTTTATVREDRARTVGGGPQNQPRPGEGRRNKGKGKAAPKPIVRPEVSDEEVSKQVKDTLARLTAKGVQEQKLRNTARTSARPSPSA